MRAAEVVWALAATVPLSAAGLAAGAVLERAGVSAKVRERVFGFAFWLGPAAVGLALLADALPRAAAAEITVVLRGTPLGVLSRATRALAQAPHIHMPQAAELLLSAIALGAAFRLTRLGRAWLALRALRRQAGTAPVETVLAARAAGVSASVPVKLSASASTPVAAGWLRPEILLPERFSAPEAAALVCRHEAQHILRRDNLRLSLEQLASALLWFDLPRGLLHRRLLAAREERCDAAALKGCTPAERDAYARTLLAELTRARAPMLAVGLIGDGRSHAMARISAIVDPRPARRRPALTLGLCTLLAAVGGGMAYAASQALQPSPNWVRKAVAAASAIRLAPPRAGGPNGAAPVVAAAFESRAPGTHRRSVRAIEAAPIEAPAAPRTPAGLPADDPDGMLVLLNGDMDTEDMGHMVRRLVLARGVPVTADDVPQLEQAVLRSATGGPHIDVQANHAEWFDGSERFSGNVEVSGDLRRAFEGALIMIDSRPLPPGTVVSSRLAADAIDFRRIAMVGPTRFRTVNIHGLRLAQ